MTAKSTGETIAAALLWALPWMVSHPITAKRDDFPGSQDRCRDFFVEANPLGCC
ncbi:MAG: hypothetical protein JRF57_06925 [Deltaproteobacteria bacterium]|nr:hypothetical protein [Deltaproteobacteria bacterium]MBW2303432.1 hypothetical protein [Deltaproteobacteria bacterium]